MSGLYVNNYHSIILCVNVIIFGYTSQYSRWITAHASKVCIKFRAGGVGSGRVPLEVWPDGQNVWKCSSMYVH